MKKMAMTILLSFSHLLFLRCISATCEQKTKVHPTFLFCICYEPLFLCPTVNIFCIVKLTGSDLARLIICIQLAAECSVYPSVAAIEWKRENWDHGRPKEFKRSSGLAFNFSGFFSQFNTSHYQSSHGRAKSCRLWMKEVMLRLRFWLDDEDDDDDETGVLIGGCGGWLYGGGRSATGDPQTWTKHFDNNPVEESIVKVFINAKDIHTQEFIKKDFPLSYTWKSNDSSMWWWNLFGLNGGCCGWSRINRIPTYRLVVRVILSRFHFIQGCLYVV